MPPAPPVPAPAGSKNAGFFMGSSIKVATRKEGEPYVHELGLAAADLEQRYHNREVGGSEVACVCSRWWRGDWARAGCPCSVLMAVVLVPGRGEESLQWQLHCVPC